MRDLIGFCVLALIAAVIFAAVNGCDTRVNHDVKSDSGVAKAHVDVTVGSDGLTVEQRNVKERYKRDNDLGAVKHLYIVSAYSGQTILYSTVKGKVTSSGKRLTPTEVESALSDGGFWYGGMNVDIAGRNTVTGEVLQDDGTYGSSAEYIFWIDERGAYHQHYVSGGQIVHISDKPVQFGSVQMEINK